MKGKLILFCASLVVIAAISLFRPSEARTNRPAASFSTTVPSANLPREPMCYTVQDFLRVKLSYGCAAGDTCYDELADFNTDGRVDTRDFNLLRRDFNNCTTETPEPLSTPLDTPTETKTPFPTTTSVATLEAQMMALINERRAEEQTPRPALLVEPHLGVSSRGHSVDMADHQLCSHTGSDGSSPWDRIAASGYTGFGNGEVIACGYQTAQEAVDAWWASPGHHDILVNPDSNDIGCGVWFDAEGYGWYTCDTGIAAATATVTRSPTRTRTATVTRTPTRTATPATGLPWLSVQGGRIVRQDTGEEVALRGVNLLRNEWVYPSMTYERAAFPVLRSEFVNFIVRGFASRPVAQGDAGYLAALDEMVNLAEQSRMYICLSYYYEEIDGDQPPIGTVDPYWQQALVTLVQRYRDRSNVLFLLENEPHSDWWPSYPNGTYILVTWNDLRPIYDQAITAMRQVDNPSPYKHIYIATGDGWGRDARAVLYDEYGCGCGPDPITADGFENISYGSHPYDSAAESDNWSYMFELVDAGLPMIVTEHGTGGQTPHQDEVQLVTMMGERHVSHAAWIWDSEGCPCLLSNRSNFTLSQPYGQFYMNVVANEATRFP